jgi:hypothetical protein
MAFNTIIFNIQEDIASQILVYQKSINENPYNPFIFDLSLVMKDDNFIDYLNEIHQQFNAIYYALLKKDDMLFNECMNPLYLGLLDYTIKNHATERQKTILNHPIFLEHVNKYCEMICTTYNQALFTPPHFINDQYLLFSNLINHYDDNQVNILSPWFSIFESHLKKIDHKHFRNSEAYKLREHMLGFLFHELINEHELKIDPYFYLNNFEKLNHIISHYPSFEQQSFHSISLHIMDFFIAPNTYGYSSDMNEALKQSNWIFDLLTQISSPHWKNVDWSFAMGIQLINQNKFKDYLIQHDEVEEFLTTVKSNHTLDYLSDNKSILNKWDEAFFYLIDQSKNVNGFNILNTTFIEKTLPKTYLLVEKMKLEQLHLFNGPNKKIKNKL